MTDACVDKGYRGHDYQGEAQVHIAGSSTKKLSRSQKKRRKRRSAVERKIGHLKNDYRLGRCFGLYIGGPNAHIDIGNPHGCRSNNRVGYGSTRAY